MIILIEDLSSKCLGILLLQNFKDYKPWGVKWGKDAWLQQTTHESPSELFTDIKQTFLFYRMIWLTDKNSVTFPFPFSFFHNKNGLRQNVMEGIRT